jgi:hypothetical protein
MAIEWDTRIERPFTFAQLRDRTEAALHDLLGLVPTTLQVTALDSDQVYPLQDLWAAIPLPARDLNARRAPWGPDARCLLAVHDRDAAVLIDVHFDPQLLQYDSDPEFGTRCNVDAGIIRWPLSYALGIAAVIAAAELVGSNVLDDSILLNQGRFVDPDSLMQALRATGPEIDVERAVGRLLAKTRLVNRTEPS